MASKRKMPQFFQDYLFGISKDKLTSDQREELLDWFDHHDSVSTIKTVNAVIDVLSEDYIEGREI